MPTANRRQQVEAIFHQVMDTPSGDTQALLDQLCQGDTQLRDEVEQLILLDDERLGDFMQVVPSEDTPTRIGSYRVLQRIGEGGMGTVYLAEQHNPRRRVAIKLMRNGIVSRDLRRRFAYEAQVLGRLSHAGIAPIYEASIGPVEFASGQTFDQPFFAMEYIEGSSLTEFSRERGLGTQERIELMIATCQAVHAAHQQGVIHRDLKPSNILITELGQPKIVDFGVARCVSEDAQVTSLHTRVGLVLGTLAYMSPEQAAATHDSMADTRSDVYSLGAVAYELLSGQLPLDLGGCSLPHALQRIQEWTPPRLSDHDASLRGDLETVIHQALEKDVGRRYQSALEFGSDLIRFQKHQPVMARPDSPLYVVLRFAQRHRAAVTAATVGLAAILVAGIAAVVLAIGQARALRDSEQMRLATEEINRFLNDDLLASANPYHTGSPDVRVRTILDRAAATLESRFQDRPEIEASIRDTLGRTYLSVGAVRRSNGQLQRALELHEALYGQSDSRTLNVRNQLAHSLIALWQLEEADAMTKQTVQLAEESLGPTHERTADAKAVRAVLLKRQGRFLEAERCYRRALRIYQDGNDRYPRRAPITKNNLALVLSDQEKYEEAERLLREVVDSWGKLQGLQSADAAYGMTNLGHVLWKQSQHRDRDDSERQRKHDEAADLFSRALAIRQRTLGQDHPETLRSLYATGLILHDRGHYAQAEAQQLQVLEMRRKLYGTDEHPDVLNALQAVGNAQSAQGKYEAAARSFLKALFTALETFEPDHFLCQDYRKNLHRVLAQLTKKDQLVEAAELHRELVARTQALWGASDPRLAEALIGYAGVLLRDEQYEDAEKALREAERIARSSGPAEGHVLRVALGNLAIAMHGKGDLKGAEAIALEAVAMTQSLQTHREYNLAMLKGLLATIYFDRGEFEEARAVRQQALAHARRFAEPLEGYHHIVSRLLSQLAEVCVQQGEFDTGLTHLLEAQRIAERVHGKPSQEVADILTQLSEIHCLLDDNFHPKFEAAAADKMLRELDSNADTVSDCRILDEDEADLPSSR